MSFKINDTTVIDNSRNVPSTATGVTGLTNFTVPNGNLELKHEVTQELQILKQFLLVM